MCCILKTKLYKLFQKFIANLVAGDCTWVQDLEPVNWVQKMVWNSFVLFCIKQHQQHSAIFFLRSFLVILPVRKANSKAKSWQEMLTREIDMNRLFDDILMHLNFYGFVIVIETIDRNIKWWQKGTEVWRKRKRRQKNKAKEKGDRNLKWWGKGQKYVARRERRQV